MQATRPVNWGVPFITAAKVQDLKAVFDGQLNLPRVSLKIAPWVSFLGRAPK
jgi:hypothetical protein